jgi:FtsH-binding integral membrane protein
MASSNSIVKKVAAYVLVSIIIVLTVLSILAIWEVIDMEDVGRKLLMSLFVVFVAAVVVLFIFSVLIKDPDNRIEASNS